ncbi:putative Thiamine-phosphate diphosphorylase [Bradyrhizobium sp. ORS 278]|uniref:thiamine phosphate synthase n=1 Tax=Bradyrhizobium sp. (strain ORS 278) TaxID=114615 RepID=UPI00015077D3|nr:putative Thiamine-phosphate diphosphorylase [Bradyrhizobium sp. ORS 278]
MPFDLRLYAIVDPEQARGRDLADLARRCVEGGATLVQLRDKRSSKGAFVEQARAIKSALAPHGAQLIINDRIDVVLDSGADGVHIGPDDITAEDTAACSVPVQSSACRSNRRPKPRQPLWP